MSLAETSTVNEKVQRFIRTPGGNRAAITKMGREVQGAAKEQVMASSKQITAALFARLDSISLSLKQKQNQNCLKQLDDNIVKSIDVPYITKDMEESLGKETKI